MTAVSMLAPSKTLALYPYQATAIDRLRDGLIDGHTRQILCAPTGAGKTEMAIYLIQEAQERGSRVAFVCDRRVLVKQTSDRFSDYGIPHGVTMAASTEGRAEPIQVCSAQTLEKRGYWDDIDLLVIDEAHTQRKAMQEFAMEWGGPVIGLTATPLTDGLGKTYSNVINATTTDQLLKDEYLAPLRIFAAKEIDMTGARKTAGEWRASEVRKRGSTIIGDIVSEWVRMTHEHFGGPVKTLAFSADVAHGEEICRGFQRAGYDFRQSTYRDSDDDTERMVNAFRRGHFTGLVSVEKFVKGFDVPDILCMIGARPYSGSLAAVIQQLGRGMRTAPGKGYCLYLDHAGNMAGWYEDICDFWADGVSVLDDGKKKEQKARREGMQRPDVKCRCGFVLLPGITACPSCGRERNRRTQAEVVAGRMEALTAPGSREWMQDKRWTWRHMCRVAIEWKRGDIDGAARLARAQYRALYDDWAPFEWGFAPAEGLPDRRVERRMGKQLKAFRESQRTK